MVLSHTQSVVAHHSGMDMPHVLGTSLYGDAPALAHAVQHGVELDLVLHGARGPLDLSVSRHSPSL